jgi:CelD/BcsL family acetyltransferase involved in cellulose biosynthesis
VKLVKSEALRPATALPVTLGGRHSTGYYGLSAPLLALVIGRPTVTGASQRFRRCSRRKFCAALGALLTP